MNETNGWTQEELDEIFADGAKVEPEDHEEKVDYYKDAEIKLAFNPHTATPEELIERNKQVKDNFQKKPDSSTKIPMLSAEQEFERVMSKCVTNGLADTFLAVMEHKEELDANHKEPVVAVEPEPEICDLYLAYNHMFSITSKLAFKRTVTVMKPSRTIGKRSDQREVVDEVKQFAVVAVGEDKIMEAAQTIANVINTMSKLGYVTGALGKLSAIQIFSEPHELPKYIVASYPVLTKECCLALDNSDTSGAKEVKKYLVKENALPNIRV